MTTASILNISHLFIPILGLLIPIIAILAHYLTKAYVSQQRHETIREFVRAGQPVPPELLAEQQDSGWSSGSVREPPNQNRFLLPAVVNAALGVGLMGLFAVMSPGSWLWAIGLLPLCLGLGLGLLWSVCRQQQPPRA